MAKIDKRRSIGLAAKELGVQEYTMRFWETQFPQIKPVIGRGNRRYYFDKELAVVGKIQYFLHDEGYTIKGLQKLLSKNKGLLKKSLDELRKTKGIGINVKAVGKNAIVDTVCDLVDVMRRVERMVGKIED